MSVSREGGLWAESRQVTTSKLGMDGAKGAVYRPLTEL